MNRTVTNSIAACAVALSLPWAAARAELAGPDWMNLATAKQRQYLNAVISRMLSETHDQTIRAYGEGARKCFKANGVSPQMVADRITSYYRQHVESRAEPVSLAMKKALFLGLCRPYIDEFRAQAGLGPLS